MKATEKGIKDPMSSSKASKSETAELAAKTVARLYFLDLSAGRILTSNPDGSDLESQAAPARREEPETLLVGPRRNASHALESRRLEHRNARGNGTWRCRPA